MPFQRAVLSGGWGQGPYENGVRLYFQRDGVGPRMEGQISKIIFSRSFPSTVSRNRRSAPNANCQTCYWEPLAASSTLEQRAADVQHYSFIRYEFKRFRAAAVGPVLLRLQGNGSPKGATNARAAPRYTTMVGISRKLRGSSPGIRRNRLEGRRHEGMNSIEFR